MRDKRETASLYVYVNTPLVLKICNFHWLMLPSTDAAFKFITKFSDGTVGRGL